MATPNADIAIVFGIRDPILVAVRSDAGEAGGGRSEAVSRGLGAGAEFDLGVLADTQKAGELGRQELAGQGARPVAG